MTEFLTANPIKLNEEELGDIQRRKEMDEKRIEEQRQFYEIARQRAKELDVYMERFRRDIIESSMLTSELNFLSLLLIRLRRIIEALRGDQDEGEDRRPQLRL